MTTKSILFAAAFVFLISCWCSPLVAQTPSVSIAYKNGTATVTTTDRASLIREAADKVERQYGDFLSAYEASGKDSDALKAMLIERDMISADIFAAAMARNGAGPLGPDMTRQALEASGKATNEYTAQMRMKLGDDDFLALQAYQLRAPERAVAAELSRRLKGTGDELTGEQGSRFIEILYKSKEASGGRRIVASFNPKIPRPRDQEPVRLIPLTVFQSLEGVLSTRQISVLGELYASQHPTS